MPNSKYDHTSSIIAGPGWMAGRIVAFLFEHAVFDKTDTLLSEVKSGGAVQRNVTEIQNRSVGENGEAFGLSALFNVTQKGSPYQMVLAWDRHESDMAVLAFYDEDEGGEPIGLQNNGTLVVRPMDFDQATGLGTWFVL